MSSFMGTRGRMRLDFDSPEQNRKDASDEPEISTTPQPWTGKTLMFDSPERPVDEFEPPQLESNVSTPVRGNVTTPYFKAPIVRASPMTANPGSLNKRFRDDFDLTPATRPLSSFSFKSDILAIPRPEERPINIIFPDGSMPVKDILVLDTGLPTPLNGWKRTPGLVTKVFVDNVRRRESNAAYAEMQRLDLARSQFDPKGKIAKLDDVSLFRVTPAQYAQMLENMGVFSEEAKAKWSRPLDNYFMILSPYVGRSLATMINSGRLHCTTAVNRILKLLVPFVHALDECNTESGMLHNDVTTLNVCFSEKDDRLYLIDFEKLAPRGESPANKDMRSVLSQVVAELAEFMSPVQQEYWARAKTLPADHVSADTVVTILQNLVAIDY